MHVPSDIKILEAIWDRHYPEFSNYRAEAPDRCSKIYVPIDIAAIAAELRVDADVVFGRLYYHLENKYGYRRSTGDTVHFFALSAGTDRHVVNFPLMGSVLAGLQDESRRFFAATSIAAASFLISVVALFASIIN